MRTRAEFDEFYEQNLLPHLKELEVERIKCARKAYLYLIPYSIFCLLLTVTLVKNIGFALFDAPGEICGSYIALIFGIGYAIYYAIIKSYVSDFKEYIITGIVGFVDDTLKYQKDGKIKRKEFRKCKIFKMGVDTYSGDDRVVGKIGSTKIRFSEIHAEYTTNDTSHTIFKGLFFVADFNKDFQGRTFLLPDRAEAALGWIGTKLQSLNKAHGDLVKLEDPVFERLFAVYGSDQIEARYILTPSLMERVVNFKRKSLGAGARELHMSFVDSNVYIALSYSRNLFEPSVFKTILDPQDIRQYFDDLIFVLGIVEDLNLNLRIWSKKPTQAVDDDLESQVEWGESAVEPLPASKPGVLPYALPVAPFAIGEGVSHAAHGSGTVLACVMTGQQWAVRVDFSTGERSVQSRFLKGGERKAHLISREMQVEYGRPYWKKD